MTKLAVYCVLLILSILSSFAQQIKFVSLQDSNPLKNVLIFNPEGLLITNSDENGLIEIKLLPEKDHYFIANYNNVVQDTVRLKEIKNNTFYLDTKIINLSEVVISKNNKNAEIIVVEGYFNNIITNNKRVTGYIEGKIQYLFDYNSKKYKDKKLLQYRIFKVKNSNVNHKEIETYDFDSYKLPELKKIADFNSLKAKFKYDEKIDNQNFKDIYLTKVLLKEEESLKLFGFVFKNFYEKINIQFNSNELNINNLIFYSSIESVDSKRKSETDFSSIQKIINFYPDNLYYLTKKEAGETKEVSLDKNHSNYTTLFWQFIPMYKNVKSYEPFSFVEGLGVLDNKHNK